VNFYGNFLLFMLKKNTENTNVLSWKEIQEKNKEENKTRKTDYTRSDDCVNIKTKSVSCC
jgi:hypothetical protein